MSGYGCEFSIPLNIEQLNKSEIAKIIEDYLEKTYGNSEDSSKWTSSIVYIRGYYTNEYNKRHLYRLRLFKDWYDVAVSMHKDKEQADICILRNGIIKQKKLIFR